jgi:hypothetical protein
MFSSVTGEPLRYHLSIESVEGALHAIGAILHVLFVQIAEVEGRSSLPILRDGSAGTFPLNIVGVALVDAA